MSRAINKRKIIVAMSGGVDSSVAALLLCRAGWEVLGATMETGYGRASDQAAEVCRQLGIEHMVVDIRAEFERQVVGGFVDAYLQGLTPNPCVDCNSRVKFPAFAPLLEQSGAEALATGHYVRISREQGRYLLHRAVDEQKDQSYFLYQLDQVTLSRCHFPLGGLTKPQIRQLATEAGLSSATQKDSYDVCFIEGGDYRQLLRQRAAQQLIPGDIVDTEGRLLGRHQGLANYTLGQRHGLSVALGQPAYAVALDQEQNRLVVGEKAQLYHQQALLDEVNILPQQQLSEPLQGQIKIRYKSPPAAGTLYPVAGQPRQLRLVFEQPVWGMTPGQSAVCYQDQLLVGGGKIIAVY